MMKMMSSQAELLEKKACCLQDDLSHPILTGQSPLAAPSSSKAEGLNAQSPPTAPSKPIVQCPSECFTLFTGS